MNMFQAFSSPGHWKHRREGTMGGFRPQAELGQGPRRTACLGFVLTRASGLEEAIKIRQSSRRDRKATAAASRIDSCRQAVHERITAEARAKSRLARLNMGC